MYDDQSKALPQEDIDRLVEHTTQMQLQAYEHIEALAEANSHLKGQTAAGFFPCTGNVAVNTASKSFQAQLNFTNGAKLFFKGQFIQVSLISTGVYFCAGSFGVNPSSIRGKSSTFVFGAQGFPLSGAIINWRSGNQDEGTVVAGGLQFGTNALGFGSGTWH